MKFIRGEACDPSDNLAVVETYWGFSSLRTFAMGFIESALHTAKLLQENRCSVDTVTPATLYQVRHSVELFLKFLIHDLEIVPEEKVIEGHKVRDIYDRHSTMIELAFQCEELHSRLDYRQWLKHFESILDAVTELDEDGQSIRYPFDRSGTPNQGGSFVLSTGNLLKCIQSIQNLYWVYDERNC